jgi:hypothetical protein
MAEKTSIPLSLVHEHQRYEGWATPSDKHHTDGHASSYHVVLNEVFFGDMSFTQGNWVISEQRPHELVAAVGSVLQQALDKSAAAPST